MKKIKSFKDLSQTQRYIPLVVSMAGENAAKLKERQGAAQAGAKALKDLKERLLGQTPPVEIPLLETAIEREQAKADKLRSDIENSAFVELFVRGLTPAESFELANLRPLSPQPPQKLREAQNGVPLDQVRRIEPTQIQDQYYADKNDPAYLKELEQFNQEMELFGKRSLAYLLIHCVQGFDLSDDEIQAETGEPAHPKTPISEYKLRMDQVSQILLSAMDLRTLVLIENRISELSGTSERRLDFLSGSSPLPNSLTGIPIL